MTNSGHRTRARYLRPEIVEELHGSRSPGRSQESNKEQMGRGQQTRDHSKPHDSFWCDVSRMTETNREKTYYRGREESEKECQQSG
jgi:hypothetical protein